jgi:hypothetical protein
MAGLERGVYNSADSLRDIQITTQNSRGIASGFIKVSASLSPASVAGGTTVEQAFTVTGLLPGDWVSVTPPGLTAGVVLANSRVSAANTLQLQFANATAGALSPPSGTYVILIAR